MRWLKNMLARTSTLTWITINVSLGYLTRIVIKMCDIINHFRRPHLRRYSRARRVLFTLFAGATRGEYSRPRPRDQKARQEKALFSPHPSLGPPADAYNLQRAFVSRDDAQSDCAHAGLARRRSPQVGAPPDRRRAGPGERASPFARR